MAQATTPQTKPRKKSAQVAIPGINQIYRLPLVSSASGDSGSTVYRKMKQGLFVRPIKLGGDRSGWPSNEVQAIIDARIAGKTDDEIKTLVIKLEAARGAK